MTDYDIKETSISDSAPYELYEFVGTYRNYYLTSDYISHFFGGFTYEPSAGLKRSNVSISTHEADGGDITVEVHIDEQIVKDYAFQTTPPSLSLTIYRFQRDAASYVTYWKGPVNSISINNEFAIFRTPSKFNSVLQGNIPNVYVQPPCNNVLFDSLCKVSRSANSVTTEVTAVNGTTITVASVGSFSGLWFKGGEVAIPTRNERRMIVDQSGTTLTVNYEFARISEGTAVEITAGCDHSYSGADGCPKFANQANFGGLPFVPGETNNVFTKGLK